MRIIRGLPSHAETPVALTIGNFDGVHRGHQAMLDRLTEAAEDLRLAPVVLTFDPHPREFLAPGRAPPRVCGRRDKFERFAALGVARTIVARFDATLAQMLPQAFVDDVLVRRLGTRWVLVGDDFRFGRERAGDLAVLRRCARTFSVEAMASVEVTGERVSSTAVRDALARGDLSRAADLLGHPFTIGGRVIHGDKRGRELGFPTANLRIAHPAPLAGIFAVQVHGLADAPIRGVASLGVRPTVVVDGALMLEVFLFDFDAPIYGRRIAVDFLHKLRDEARYDDLATLTRQIATDVADAHRYFATQHPLHRNPDA